MSEDARERLEHELRFVCSESTPCRLRRRAAYCLKQAAHHETLPQCLSMDSSGEAIALMYTTHPSRKAELVIYCDGAIVVSLSDYEDKENNAVRELDSIGELPEAFQQIHEFLEWNKVEAQ